MEALSHIANVFATLTQGKNPSELSSITDIYLRVQGEKLSIERPSLTEKLFSKGSFRFSTCATSLSQVLKKIAQSKIDGEGKSGNVQKLLDWCTKQAQKYERPWWAGIAKFFGITKAIAQRERIAKELQDSVSDASLKLFPTPAPAPKAKKRAPKTRPQTSPHEAAPVARGSGERELAIQEFEEAVGTRDDEISQVVQEYLTPRHRQQLVATGKVTVEEMVKKGKRPKFKIKLASDGGKIRIIAREYITEGGFAMLFRKSEWTGKGWNITAYRKPISTGPEEVKEELSHSLEISHRIHERKAPHVIQMDEVPKGTDASVVHGASKVGTKASSMRVFYDGDLEGLIEDETLKPAQRQSVAMQMAQAIQEFHAAQTYHLDIKPGNFLFKRSDSKIEVVLTDFGLSKTSGEDPLTNFRGTSFFAPPEILALMQKDKAKRTPIPLSPSIDMYSLGLSLLELCTGHKKLVSSGVAGKPSLTQARNINKVVAAFRDDLRDSPQEIGQLIYRLLDPSPETRSKCTIDEVIAILKGWDGKLLPLKRNATQILMS
jgi:hypothetical protein